MSAGNRSQTPERPAAPESFIAMICVIGISVCEASAGLPKELGATLDPEHYQDLGAIQLLAFVAVVSLAVTAFSTAQGFKVINRLTQELSTRPCIWQSRVEIKE